MMALAKIIYIMVIETKSVFSFLLFTFLSAVKET